MRMIASAVLAVMAALFIAAVALRPMHPAFAWLEAFAGAGLAGGLADWFAVTALFRRPLGLPIPHTAIIPANRARIGQALGDFIADQLLTPALVDNALARFDATALLPQLFQSIPRPELEQGLTGLLRSGLSGVAAAPAAGALLSQLWTPERSNDLTGQAVDALSLALTERHDALRDELAAQGATWTPKWIDRMLADRVLQGVEGLLQALKSPDHPWRIELDQTIAGLADRLAHDPALSGPAQHWKDDLLSDAVLEGLAAQLADGLSAMTPAPETAARVNGALRTLLATRILAERPTVARLVCERLAQWDERELVDELELQTGRDLQYIRINGALVGAVAGLAIHATSLLLGH